MTSKQTVAGETPGARIGVRHVAQLAWPAVLSYLLSNAYRINDQFWIQGLGPEAQAAVGGTVFVVIMNFSVVFLAAGGTLALVARASGARDLERRDALIASAMVLSTAIWIVLACVGPFATPHIVEFLGLRGETATFATDYLRTLYLCSLPLVLAPALDHVLIGIGSTRVMCLMELLAVALHYLLAPMLIYGARAAEFSDAPLAKFAGGLAGALGIEGHGIVGAAWSAALARAISVTLGLFALRRLHGVRLRSAFAHARRLGGRALLVLDIARISLPVSLSIATYASVYWALIKWVVVPLGDDALAALGIGFTVFEGVSFPLFLGVAMAGASLVGRSLGAGRIDEALDAVRGARKLSLGLGVCIMIAFWVSADALAPLFSPDLGVQREVIGYVTIISFSQVFVAIEAANEKVLLGAGYTRPAMWVSMLGNGLRVPLAWLLAIQFDFGVHGVWWAINLTSALKASLQFALVARGRWLVAPIAVASGART